MPNINVKKRLEKLSAEMEKLRQHVLLHSGISAEEAYGIENLAAGICQDAARLVGEAQSARARSAEECIDGSDSREYGPKVEKAVRKALGCTYP